MWLQEIGEHAAVDERVPERPGMLGPDLALVGAGKAVDGMHRMMAEHQLVSRIGVLAQDVGEPRRLDVTFATETRPHRIDEDQQQVVPPHPVGQAFLAGGPLRGRWPSISRNTASLMVSVGSCGLLVEFHNGIARRSSQPISRSKPVAPLRPQLVGIGAEPRDLVAEEEDEVPATARDAARRHSPTQRPLGQAKLDRKRSNACGPPLAVASIAGRLSARPPAARARHQFVVYAIVLGHCRAPHEDLCVGECRRAASRAVAHFILFLGDEIAGLSADADELRAQWRHWLDREDGLARPARDPVVEFYQQPHDLRHHERRRCSARCWAICRATALPARKACPTGCGGTTCCWSSSIRCGRVSVAKVTSRRRGSPTSCASTPMRDTSCARPSSGASPSTAFPAPYQREVGPEHAGPFWDTLVDGRRARLSLQPHSRVRRPGSSRRAADLHRGAPERRIACRRASSTCIALQAALDADGLRYQVLDAEGHAREGLSCRCTRHWSTNGVRCLRAKARPCARAGRRAIASWRCALPGDSASAGDWFGADPSCRRPS